MNKLFEKAQVAGIIAPGECYILNDDSDGCRLELSILYLIRRDEDILPAIEMETCIVMEPYQDLLEFLGWERISEITYAFRMRCYFKEEAEVGEYTLYLHRVKEFVEELEEMKELFGRMEYAL